MLFIGLTIFHLLKKKPRIYFYKRQTYSKLIKIGNQNFPIFDVKNTCHTSNRKKFLLIFFCSRFPKFIWQHNYFKNLRLVISNTGVGYFPVKLDLQIEQTSHYYRNGIFRALRTWFPIFKPSNLVR